MNAKLITHTPKPELVIEEAGRICYESRDKIKPGSHKPFIKNIIKRGHTSVLEHASATIELNEVSLVMVQQLLRHRILSFSQRSLRYCKLESIKPVIPDEIKENPKALKIFMKTFEQTVKAYFDILDCNVKPQSARYILPTATPVKIVVSGNFRAWREMLELRTKKNVQPEFRKCALHMVNELIKLAPMVFNDLL